MVDRERPCDRGLTPECFEEYPEWAKQAFAYRLLHTLFPPEITRRLPRRWWAPLIGPGANVPDEVDLPPGTVVPPYYDWDPVWTPWWLSLPWWLIWPEEDIPPDAVPDYPPPPDVVIPPGGDVPLDAGPDYPPPADVVIPPGTVFPDDWRIGDPLPPGVKLPSDPSGPGPTTPIRPVPPGVGGRPRFLEAARVSGIPPPLNLATWTPGPVHRVAAHVKGAVAVSITAHTNDGRVGYAAIGWDATRNAPTGTTAKDNERYSDIGTWVYRWNSSFNIHRSFFCFNLEPVPAGSKILAVVVTIGGRRYATDQVCIQEGLQGWTLFQLDYDSFTGDCFDHIPWRVSGADGTNLNEFTLNAAGRAFVARRASKWIRFCTREYDHDYLDIIPVVGVRFQNGIYYANHTVAACRPIITVTYK